jgi:flagellar biogenesis protein FliO
VTASSFILSTTGSPGSLGNDRGEGRSYSRLPKSNTLAIAVLLKVFLFANLSVSAETLATNAVSLATNAVSLAPAAMGTNLPDTGASVFRVLGALILVIAIFLGGVWLFKNWQRVTAGKNGAAKLNLLEVKSLGQRQAIYVVGYQQQRMLLASSPAGITLLSHLPAADETEIATPAPKMNFAEAFQQVLSRGKS